MVLCGTVVQDFVHTGVVQVGSSATWSSFTQLEATTTSEGAIKFAILPSCMPLTHGNGIQPLVGKNKEIPITT